MRTSIFDVVWRFVIAIVLVITALQFVVRLLDPEAFTLWEVGESALFVGALAFALWYEFNHRHTLALNAVWSVALLYSAFLPEYTAWTVVTAALGGAAAFATWLLWSFRRSLSEFEQEYTTGADAEADADSRA